jgi:hypothetical protein
MSSETELGLRRAKCFALFAAVLVASAGAAAAKPAFMDRYNADPFARPELRNKCTVCHIGHGGGERTDFGEAFADAGYRITPKLRAKFPSVFTTEPAKP